MMKWWPPRADLSSAPIETIDADLRPVARAWRVARYLCRCAVSTMKLCIIVVRAPCTTHQCGSRLLVSNGIKEPQMATALTDRIVARYVREAERRHAEASSPPCPARSASGTSVILGRAVGA